MAILEALNWRYAVREFSNTKLSDDVIAELVEATRLSPSAYGLQPYKLIVIKSPEIKALLLPYAMGQKKVGDCSHLFVLTVNTRIDAKFIEQHFAHVEYERGLAAGTLAGFEQHVKEVMLSLSTEQLHQWAENQVHIALGNLLTAAAIKGVDACPMAGFENQGFDEVLGLAEKQLRTSVICALGERAKTDASAGQRKVRLPVSDFSVEI
ncbi:NAD(P)H-dependent oxidoreductase [Bowmanella yangjiangensis]|uniref:NAD(P)H-dependent oxidoreductase n=1 Tax=Bowmanella yangjiangensis TaxID=2811230 RepID=A0ABS3CRJ7_9ALTE|nr:NAD(P)H-dependent oxidoreductase [Bowmanella yangjiangensis]MBN7819742.1 NAD(P)H-dependent oxidoreductase [Bowmanella yangjiangensis]